MAKDEMKRVHGNLHVHMVPALSDNYVFIIQEQTFGKVAVIDPSEFGPVSNAVDAIGLRASTTSTTLTTTGTTPTGTCR